MDVVRTVNENNVILPAGDVKIGPVDYNLYTNSQLPTTQQINDMPLKTVNNASVLVRDVGKPKTRSRSRPTLCASMDSRPSICRF